MHKIFKNLQMSSTNSASGLGQEFPTKLAVYSSRLQGNSSPWTEEKLMPKHPSTQADNILLRFGVFKVELTWQGMDEPKTTS